MQLREKGEEGVGWRKGMGNFFVIYSFLEMYDKASCTSQHTHIEKENNENGKHEEWLNKVFT